MKKKNQQLPETLEQMALNIVMLDHGDIAGLGDFLKLVEAAKEQAENIPSPALRDVLAALEGYIERVILAETDDLKPAEAAVTTLQTLNRRLERGDAREENISELLAVLSGEAAPAPDAADEKPAADAGAAAAAETSDADPPIDDPPASAPVPFSGFSQEDIEITQDFISESLDNLESIEFNLMELEQDPGNLDTINAIFRPFHTVKGVSGFLNFNRINRLAHISENLLDQVRNNEISIDDHVVDAILESVDLLKKIIGNVQTTLDAGAPSEGDFDIEPTIARIDKLLKGGDHKKIGEILIDSGVIDAPQLEKTLENQKTTGGKKLGEILVESKQADTKDVINALRQQKKSGQVAALQIKIDTDKLDTIVDMVGELAIAQSMLRQNDSIRAAQNNELDKIVSQLSQITSVLQKTAMSLRMIPIKNTFQKMTRLVRDLARKAGKEVRLEMSGEDTEVDRNMVEEIYEPMVHMIRNSIDHGLETGKDREAAGKSAVGRIVLSAYHKGGNIVIEIEDDGKGLDADKILKKAVEKGLVGEGEKLTESEIQNLIFHAGFSTADKITDISGRGVGMDVVKSTIQQKLRGRVEVLSSAGKWTRVIIRLPLTLAILDGMIVKLGGERYVIPTLSVQESLKPEKKDCVTVKAKGEMIKIRENLIPLVRLEHLLGSNGGNGMAHPWECLVVVVENQEKKLCLLIDELLGQEEVVIKSLGEKLKNVKGIAGGTIMGDGRVSLILDVAEIFSMTQGQ